MKKELQDKLFEKYPKIFRQKDLSKQETAMCWGIACGDGWYSLIDELCCTIQNRVENVNRSRQNKIKSSPGTLVPTKFDELICEAVQVKEKWGGLCFYTCGGDDFIDGAIDLAESLSHKTCVSCGAPREQKGRGWMHALCVNCKDDQERKHELWSKRDREGK